MTLPEFIATHDLALSCSRAAEQNPFCKSSGQSIHWRCALTRRGTTTLVTFIYTHGPAHAHRAPDLCHVLNSLANDAANFERGAESFEKWAEIHERNPDSRSQERLYQALRAQTESLKTFLSPDDYWLLLHHVTRRRAP